MNAGDANSRCYLRSPGLQNDDDGPTSAGMEEAGFASHAFGAGGGCAEVRFQCLPQPRLECRVLADMPSRHRDLLFNQHSLGHGFMGSPGRRQSSRTQTSEQLHIDPIPGVWLSLSVSLPSNPLSDGLTAWSHPHPLVSRDNVQRKPPTSPTSTFVERMTSHHTDGCNLAFSSARWCSRARLPRLHPRTRAGVGKHRQSAGGPTMHLAA